MAKTKGKKVSLGEALNAIADEVDGEDTKEKKIEFLESCYDIIEARFFDEPTPEKVIKLDGIITMDPDQDDIFKSFGVVNPKKVIRRVFMTMMKSRRPTIGVYHLLQDDSLDSPEKICAVFILRDIMRTLQASDGDSMKKKLGSSDETSDIGDYGGTDDGMFM